MLRLRQERCCRNSAGSRKCEDRRMAKWERLIAAREQMHLSQLEAAEYLNVGVVTYQRWEAGKARPQPQHMRQLCAIFTTLRANDEASETSSTSTLPNVTSSVSS